MIATASASAEVTLTTSFTQVGGAYMVEPSGLLTIDGSGPPLLTLINGAMTSGVTLLKVGDTQTGSLLISDGSVFSNEGSGYLGFGTGSSGTATIDGIGSHWNNADAIEVGVDGVGVLNVVAGGKVAAAGGYLGTNVDGSGTVTVIGAGSEWNLASTTVPIGLTVGFDGVGTLNVEDGGKVTNTLRSYLGANLNSSGTATVTGVGSQWDSDDHLYVGLSGSGNLNIVSGGIVNNLDAYLGSLAGSTGTATVTGNGSTWNINQGLYIGGNDFEAGGTGSLSVSDGGTVSVTGLLRIWEGGTLMLDTGGTVASASGSVDGMATVRSSDSLWTSSNLSVGDYGTGALNMLDGGRVTNDFAYIGQNTDSIGVVTLSRTNSYSNWNVTQELVVGSSGNGTLNVLGGIVSSGMSLIGRYAGSRGTVSVDGQHGPFSSWTASVLEVGGSGTGTLNVIGGGTLTSLSTSVGSSPGSLGTVNVAGKSNFGASSWSLGTSPMYIGQAGTGFLNVTGGASVTSGTSYIANGVGSSGTVNLSGTDSSGTPSTWFFSQGALFVAYNGVGTLNVTAGGTLQNGYGGNYETYIGYASTASGTVTVSGQSSSGTGSRWNLGSNDTFVGYSGSGSLIVTDGGQVAANFDLGQGSSSYIGYNSNSSGTVTIEGMNNSGTIASHWNLRHANLYVGNSGAGTLNVTGGGKITSGNGVIGNNTGAVGSVIVSGTSSSGTSSQWNITGGDAQDIGRLGIGTLDVLGGGNVTSSANIIIGRVASGTVTVRGASSNGVASELNVGTNRLYVGTSGNGALNVLEGGHVSNGFSFIGLNSNSSGTATVTGTGSVWNISQSLYIGGNSSGPGGYGTLTIGSGGKVVVGDTLKLWNNGTLNLNSGGTLQVAHLDVSLGHFNVAAGSSLIADNSNGGGTSLTVSNNQVVNNSGTIAIPFTLDTGGQVANTGTISSTVTVGANSQVTNSGTISGLVVVNSTATVTNSNAGTVSGPVNVSGANATYINNGSTSGTTTVSSGGVVKGNGTFGTVIINAGGIGSPGNSPETMTDTSTTWSGGGKYVWEINDPADGPGQNPGWDLWNLGTLTLNVASSSNPFLVELRSVGTGVNSNTLTSLSGWNPAQSYSWKIATADSDVFTNAVLNSLLAIDSSSPFFGSNGTSSSFFHLASSNGGMELDLEYDPAAVPEPSSMLLAGMVALPVAWRKIRRRKQQVA